MSATAVNTTKTSVKFAVFQIVAGVIGWIASFELLTEFIKVLKDPEYIPNCSVSVLVTCGPNMGSWQGSVFGFSNTIIGVAAFMAPIIVGVAILAGARFAPWFWFAYQGGLLFGFVFIYWLSAQSVFSLGTLCPWCMVVWAVVIPLFWINVLTLNANGYTGLPERARNVFTHLLSWAWVLIFFSALIIAVYAQVQLNWFAELTRG